ncbi:MAG: hypothetical protein R3E64_01500 [Halioglobus sp.]
MQSTFIALSIESLLTPEIFVLATIFALAALFLFALALEAGVYPELVKACRRLRRKMLRLRGSDETRQGFPGREQIAGR